MFFYLQVNVFNIYAVGLPFDDDVTSDRLDRDVFQLPFSSWSPTCREPHKQQMMITTINQY